jgi:hypothetical protein
MVAPMPITSPGERASPPRRIVIVASASGSGKTTLGRELARLLDVAFVELDALVHGPNWTELPDADLKRLITPVLAQDGWVIDGSYERKLGSAVFDAADLVVWIDLPLHVWGPRLVKRSWRRWSRREQLWNGNRESLTGLFWGREALFVWALRSHVSRRRNYPEYLSRYNLRRLRSSDAVDRFSREMAVTAQERQRG